MKLLAPSSPHLVGRLLGGTKERLRFLILKFEKRLWPHIYQATPKFQKATGAHRPEPRILVHAHIHYPELVTELLDQLTFIPHSAEIHFSLTSNVDELTAIKLATKFPTAHVHRFENVGRDVLPFLSVLQSISLSDFDLILKIHTKKSPHRHDGDLWRKELFLSLLPSIKGVAQITSNLSRSRNVSLALPQSCIYSEQWWGSNKEIASHIAHLAGVPRLPQRFVFPAGTMFWATAESMMWVQKLALDSIDFRAQQDSLDGSAAHACERLFGAIPRTIGLEVVDIEQLRIDLIYDNPN